MRRLLARAGGAIARAVSALEVGPREGALIIALGLVGYGAGIVWLPAGFFLPGLALLYVSIFGVKR